MKVLTFECVDEILKCDHSNERCRAVLSCGAVAVLYLYKVVLTFKAVDEILKCGHSNESCWAVLFCGAVYYAVQGGSNVVTIQMKATEQYFPTVLFIMLLSMYS